jgi:hypothetical protein
MGIEANVMTPTISAYATIRCDDPQVPLLMRTSWSGWGADSSYDNQESRISGGKGTPDGATQLVTTGAASGLQAVNEM